jgi:hypothetical protein
LANGSVDADFVHYVNLATMQVDYTAAFVDAPIDLPPNFDLLSKGDKRKTWVFVAIPRGFSKPNRVLRLKKLLYGLNMHPVTSFSFSSLNWNGLDSVHTKILIPVCLFPTK